MALGPRLDLRQSQSLVMTPQLQQAIKLLALTHIELESYVSQEIEKNPLLESAPGEEFGPTEDSPDSRDLDDRAEHRDDAVRTDDLIGDGAAATQAQADNPLDLDVSGDIFHHDGTGDSVADTPYEMGGLDGLLGLNGGGAVIGSGEEGAPTDAATGTSDLSLHDVLHTQAGMAFYTLEDRAIAAYLIDHIDEAGYLRVALTEVAERLNVDLEDVDAVLGRLQTFEPTGVGARDLAECLRIQAREADRLDPYMALLLDNLDLVGKGDFSTLRRLCHVDQDELLEMIRELRLYQPKPGMAYHHERIEAIVPDLYVHRHRDGSWRVELNSATLPRLLVNRTYHAHLSGRSSKREDKIFLSECLASANWLVKALDQRARTILKVATELVRQQEEFFESGVRALKPLTLKGIADAIGMHESTVSRVTSQKYLMCDRGLLELKFFFTTAIAACDGGESHSAASVKQRIREMIDAEPAHAILSDDKIVEILQKESYDLARRTVAKYREAMRIPSSVQRRRRKALDAVG